jgi:peptide/nickel transport system permease protein
MAFFKLLRQSPLSARIGLAMILINVIAAVFTPWIAPYTETEIVGDVWLSSNSENLLGTDHLGRDLFTRLIYGARNTIAIAFATTILSFVVGIIMGFFAATLGGWTDQLLSRVIDILMAFPTLIFALMVLSVIGTSVTGLIVVIALLDSTRVYRLSRAVAMDIEVMEYVEAARLRGEGIWWVMRREILPNAMPPLVAEFGLRFCFVFLFIERKFRGHHLRYYDTAMACRGDCLPDGGREFNCRLVSAYRQRTQGLILIELALK